VRTFVGTVTHTPAHQPSIHTHARTDWHAQNILLFACGEIHTLHTPAAVKGINYACSAPQLTAASARRNARRTASRRVNSSSDGPGGCSGSTAVNSCCRYTRLAGTLAAPTTPAAATPALASAAATAACAATTVRGPRRALLAVA
jgi:hypothetical protein